MSRAVLVLLFLLVSAAHSSAEAATDAPTPLPAGSVQPAVPPSPTSDPPLRRWIEFQTLTLHARYRFLDSSRNTASHDPQYKEAVRVRFNADAKRHYTVNVGFFSGTQFIGTFDNMGLGINDGDYHSHYVKQLFVAAVPVTGLELQYGGIYVVRGENTEITTYDDDGYIVGERVTVRRPNQLFFDEIGVTHGLLGPTGVPNLFARWNGLTEPNYTQVLAAKRFTPMVAASVDYSTVSAADTVHAAVVLRLKSTAWLASVRYEQYYRMTPNPAPGFAVTAEVPPVHHVRFSGGYATIDERYDANTSRAKLNSERMQRGRRFFVTANIPMTGQLSAVLFFTRALPSTYELTNRSRVDAMVQYDLLSVLRRTAKL